MDRADGDDRLWIQLADIGACVDHVSDICRLQMAEINGGAFCGVTRAGEDSRVAQFVGHHLQMTPGILVQTIRSRSAPFQRASLVRAYVERELIPMVTLPEPEGQADLLQIIDAIDALGFFLGLGQSGQQQTGQEGGRTQQATADHQRQCPARHSRRGGQPGQCSARRRRRALLGQLVHARLHLTREDRGHGEDAEQVDIRNDLDDASRRRHARQVAGRKPVQFALFIDAQTQPAVRKKYPVQIKERYKTKTNRPAGGRIVGPDPRQFAVDQVQPDNREKSAGEKMQQNDQRHRKRIQAEGV